MKATDFIQVQTQDFDTGWHYQALRSIAPAQTGAINLFCGLVRDLNDQALTSMELEHYPGMTESCLENIVAKAHEHWSLIGVHLVHRVGVLNCHDQIVLVGVAARHRKDVFAACEFIMDYLKQDAPFWKAEVTDTGKHWVDAKDNDSKADERWLKVLNTRNSDTMSS